jgi:hypothetical protein
VFKIIQVVRLFVPGGQLLQAYDGEFTEWTDRELDDACQILRDSRGKKK